jgi:exopolyphosphatase/guanosine-5'-triphosphate,3'-diphosphate pyrophosphatase
MNHIYGAIDVGANGIKLRIVEYKSKTLYKLEDISSELLLGEDVFYNGVISHENTKLIIKTFEYFKNLMDEYNVVKYNAVGTSVMREASNSKSIVELIKMKTGLNLIIIEDTIEKFITYKSIRDVFFDHIKIRKSALIVELNSSSFDISIYFQNKLIKNDEIRLGIKQMKNDLKMIEKITLNWHKVFIELIDTKTSHIFPTITTKKLKSFIAVGGEMKKIKNLFFNGAEVITKDDYKSLLKRLESYDPILKDTIEKNGMDWHEFASTLLFYKVFLNLTQAKEILVPEISLRDGIITELIESDFNISRYYQYNNDIYNIALAISKRFESSIDHVKHIEKNAIAIIDALKPFYFFQSRDSLLLQISALLHEIGKYTNIKDYHIASYDKISNLDIFGLTNEEVMIIAHVCRLISSSENKRYDLRMEGISDDNIGTVIKLSAILSIADALDKGKKQKITINSIKTNNDYLYIYFSTNSDISLEKMSFEYTIENFVSTFGIIPLLKEQ